MNKMTKTEMLELYLKEKLDENINLKAKVDYLETQLGQFELDFQNEEAY